ncbi:hypothetical protein SAMN04488581_0385 [Mycolicibacterium neoaurum]|nr:hypothetical protein SAMN04488581_0385 [Mycolicibacterium neoaurum]
MPGVFSYPAPCHCPVAWAATDSVEHVSQLSFFSAESVPPTIADLTGLLAAQGQVVSVGGQARLSVVVDRAWRAQGLAEMIAETGLTPELTRTDEDNPLVRTALDSRVVDIAGAWTRGAVKTVPGSWLPGPRALRAWTLAAGVPEADDRYLLGLDPHAPDTHATLASALMRVGIAPTLIGTRGSRPALRVSGRRRLSRLVENVGEPPGDTEAFAHWPRI